MNTPPPCVLSRRGLPRTPHPSELSHTHNVQPHFFKLTKTGLNQDGCVVVYAGGKGINESIYKLPCPRPLLYRLIVPLPSHCRSLALSQTAFDLRQNGTPWSRPPPPILYLTVPLGSLLPRGSTLKGGGVVSTTGVN